MPSLYEQLRAEIEAEARPKPKSLFEELQGEIEAESSSPWASMLPPPTGEQEFLSRMAVEEEQRRKEVEAGTRPSQFSQFLSSLDAGMAKLERLGGDPSEKRAGSPGQKLAESAMAREQVAADLPAPLAGEGPLRGLGRSGASLGLGIATAPLSVGVAGAAAARGASPLISLLAGEAAQSVALAPLEFATRPPAEAAAVSLLAPAAGTLIGRAGAHLSGRAMAERGAEALTGAIGSVERGIKEALPAEMAESEVRTFQREAAGRALARIRYSLETGGTLPSGDLIEMGDEVVAQAAKEVRIEALQRGAKALKGLGGEDDDIAKVMAQFDTNTQGLDPTSLGIISDSISSLPPAAADKFVRRLAKSLPAHAEDLSAKVREFRSAAMLSGFGTHFRNFLATGGNVGTKPARTLGASVVDPFLAPFMSGERQRFAGEALADSYGMMRSLPEALSTLGLKSRTVRENFDKQAFSGVVGQVTGTVHKSLNAVDRMYYGRAFSSEMFKRSYRQAAKEGTSFTKILGRTGEIIEEQDKLASRIAHLKGEVETAKKALKELRKGGMDLSKQKKLVGEIRKGQLQAQAELKQLEPKSFIKDAALIADRTVFTAREGESLDQLLDAVDDMARYSIVINAVLPFRRTPANIAREAIRSSPLGFGTGLYRAAQSLAADVPMGQVQGRLADDFGQALIGTAAIYGMLKAVEAGQIRVNPFKEHKRAERVTEEAAGVVPDSVIVGGYSFPISRLEPLGSFLLSAGRLADMRAGEDPPVGVREHMEQLSTLLGTQAANEAFFDPMAEFLEAVTGDDRTMSRYAQKYGGSLMPRLVSQLDQRSKAPISEQDVKDAYGSDVIAGFRHQIPGKGKADLGLFGKEREGQTLLPNLLVGKTGKVGNDPLAQEMVRVQAYHSPPNGLSKDFAGKLSKLGITYSPDEDRTMRVVKGRAQELAVRNVVQSPRYQQLPPNALGDSVRKQLIDKAYSEASKVVDERVKALKLAKVPLTERGILGR